VTVKVSPFGRAGLAEGLRRLQESDILIPSRYVYVEASARDSRDTDLDFRWATEMCIKGATAILRMQGFLQALREERLPG
jgi:hypothetical protein